MQNHTSPSKISRLAYVFASLVVFSFSAPSHAQDLPACKYTVEYAAEDIILDYVNNQTVKQVTADMAQLATELGELKNGTSIQACWKLAEARTINKNRKLGDAFWINTAKRFILTFNQIQLALGQFNRFQNDLLIKCLPVKAECQVGKPMNSHMVSACKEATPPVPEGCKELLPPPPKPPVGPVKPAEGPRLRWLIPAAVSFVVGGTLLSLGVAQLAVPLGVVVGSQGCVQHGLYYPCGADRLGLGLPLLTAGAVVVAGAGVFLHLGLK